MNWWFRLFRRKRMEDELESELRFHLDQHASDLVVRGRTPDEARRQARFALGGGKEQVKEKCRDTRGTRWLEDVARDTRHAFRTFRKNPTFAAITAIILALGIGATTVMFAVVHGVLLKPLAFPEPDRLVTLHRVIEQFGEVWGFSNPDFGDVARDSRSLTVAAWTYGGGTISEPGEPEYVDGRQISAGLFSTLRIAPSHGRSFEPSDDTAGAAPVAILSHKFWQRRFAGDPSAIGKTIVFNGKPHAVIGIAPLGFELMGDADLMTPLAQNTEPRMRNRGANFIHVIARLRPGATLAGAQSELAVIANHLSEQFPKTNKGSTVRVRPLKQEVVADVRTTLWLLLSSVGLVLLVACVNIAGLFLTRAMSRERELAMRVALGAGRSRLMQQCLTESAVLGTCGGILGVVVATVSLRPFIALWPGSLPRAEEIHLDWPVLAFAIGMSLLSGLFFGAVPAIRVPLQSVERSLREGGRTVAGSSRRLHSVLVISEIALAFVLLVCAGMLGNTMLTLSSLDPGLNVHNVLAARFALSQSLENPAQIRAAWQDVLDRARQTPGVDSVALADIIPMSVGENSVSYRSTAEPPASNQEPIALASTVTPDYLKVMGIPLRDGRFFSEHDRIESERVVVIDENLARHAFGGQNAVGRRLWIAAFGDAPVQIVGVIGHVRHWGLADDDLSRVRDQVYMPFAQVPDSLLHFLSSVMSIAMRTKAPPLSLVEPLRFELRGVARDQALYDPRAMEQLVSASLDRQRFLLFLFGIFAAVALFLASIGIYGVLAYLTGQRVPEIGVRMALGATVRNVIGLVLGQCLQMAVVGLALGIVAALAAARVLQGVVPGMQPVHVATFGIMIPLLAAVALAAGFVPALRASRVDPVRALRQE